MSKDGCALGLNGESIEISTPRAVVLDVVSHTPAPRTVTAATPSRAAACAFEFLNRWADRIFVISLHRATDRQARIRDRLAGVEYRLAHGVDKLELDRATLVENGVYDESRTPRAFRHTRDMSLGEIGAALAHRRIYEETVRHGWRRVVVLEDDVVPLDADLVRLPDALGELPAEWELCYLGYLKGERITAIRQAKLTSYRALSPLGLCRWKPGEVRRLRSEPFSPNLRRAGLHTHAHAYAVSLDGARKLLAAQTPIAFRADWLFSWLILGGAISAYVTAPKLFEQERILGVTPAGAVDSYVHE